MKALVPVAVLALALTSFGAQAKGTCKNVEKACKAAGHKKKKDLKTCADSIKGGGTVEGVTVDQADVDACKKK